MFCRQCGTRRGVDDRFCGEGGAAFFDMAANGATEPSGEAHDPDTAGRSYRQQPGTEPESDPTTVLPTYGQPQPHQRAYRQPDVGSHGQRDDWSGPPRGGRPYGPGSGGGRRWGWVGSDAPLER